MKKTTIVGVALGLLALTEVIILVAAGRAIGAWPVIGVLALEALVGGWVVRHEGAKAWASLRSAQQDPTRRGAALTDAALVLVGALLLMLPGFVSDAVGAGDPDAVAALARLAAEAEGGFRAEGSTLRLSLPVPKA